MSATERIDSYLDCLVTELWGRAGEVRRILSEVEEHLRDAAAEGVRAGMTAEEAEAAAIARFGSPRTVARRFGIAGSPGVIVVAREALGALVMLAAVGLIAVGVSGVLAAGLRSAFGSEFVAGDVAGVTYTPQRCADFLAFHPEAGDCEAAASAHHADEVAQYRIAAGVLGLLLLGSWWEWRRARAERRYVGVLPTAFAVTVGVSVFGVAAGLLAAMTLNALLAGGRAGGAGQWLTGAVVSAVVAVVFGVSLLRRLHDGPAPV